MAIKIWKNYTESGYVMLSYSFLRALGATNAIVLAQVLAEYNHAYNKGFSAFNSFFTSTKRMAAYLGMEEKALDKALNRLSYLGLIFYLESHIDGLRLISVAEDSILEYKLNAEAQYMYADWDTGLMRLQNPVNNLEEFSCAAQLLKEFIDSYFNKENALPTIAYSICETNFRSYERDGVSQFWGIPDIKERLRIFLGSGPLDVESLCRWVVKQCNENKS